MVEGENFHVIGAEMPVRLLFISQARQPIPGALFSLDHCTFYGDAAWKQHIVLSLDILMHVALERSFRFESSPDRYHTPSHAPLQSSGAFSRDSSGIVH